MRSIRIACCAAVVLALATEVNADSVLCLKNHYILDYPCGVQAGTPPPTVLIPPVPAGVKHWTAAGPDGANVVTLVIDPVAPSNAFAGTIGSGVLKTTDGGASWAAANAGLPTANVLALAIDPATPSTLYASTDVGIFKSTDGGQGWAAANAGLGGAPQIVVNALAVDPTSPTTLYAGTSGGVFKTTNGAASWTSINAGLSGLAARVIAIDPNAPSTVYVGVDDNADYLDYGVFKSIDGGATWKKVYSTPTGEDGGAPPITALAIDPRSPSRLYALVALNQVLASPDGGASWSAIPTPAADVWSLALDPSSGTVYVGTYFGSVFRTTDGGAHWTSASDGLQASGVNVIATAPSAPASLYAGAHNGVFRSSDSAQTWTHPALGVRNLGVGPLAFDLTAPATIYTTSGSDVMKTTDGGAHWSASNAGLSPELEVDWLAVDPVSPSIVYAVQSTPFAGRTVIYKSTDGGVHWAPPSNSTFDPGALQAFAIAPTQPSTLYIGVNFLGVLKSTDGGASWAPANSGLTAAGPFVRALAVDPTAPNTVYASTYPEPPDTPAKIFKSTDGAAHWSQLSIGIQSSMIITSLVVDPAAPSTLYASYGDYGDPGQGGVFKSSDGGQTWVAASQGLPTESISRLVIGSGAPSPVYTATSAGIFASSDGAMSWAPINSAGLPNVGVGVAIDGTGSVLWAPTIVGLFEYQLPGGSPSVTVPVIEYYYAAFDHYFITANPDEIKALDSGVFPGWTRTGLQFKAYAAAVDGVSPVCRFFSTAFAPKSSHFYTPFPDECAARRTDPAWMLETAAAFYVPVPAGDGSCAEGFTAVHRLYNNGQGGAPNHRFTTDASARTQMIEKGWLPEGLGADGVAMCSPP